MKSSVWLVLVLALSAACGDSPTTPTNPPPTATVDIADLVVGTGPEVVTGHVLNVIYTGWLYDASAPDHKGAQFDSNVGGPLFSFVFGSKTVIDGWNQGLAGMHAGGTRRLTIPPELAYGAGGSGAKIPPNATLVFDIQLISVL